MKRPDNHYFVLVASAALSVCLGAACNVHDNTINIPNATINATSDADTSNVMPDQMVPIAVVVQNVYLIEPTVTPPPEHVNDAGHLQIYLDDVTTPPILITAQVMFDVKIPTETKAGGHKLICRFHKHDGTPTSTRVDVSITVKVAIGATDAGVSVDANLSVDANVTVIDAAAMETASADAATAGGG